MNTLIKAAADELGLNPDGLLESFITGIANRNDVPRNLVEGALDYLDSLEERHVLYYHIRDGKIGLTHTVEAMVEEFPTGEFPVPEVLVHTLVLEQRCLSLKHIEVDDELATASRIVDLLKAMSPKTIMLLNTNGVRQEKYNHLTSIIIGTTSEERGKMTVAIRGKERKGDADNNFQMPTDVKTLVFKEGEE